MNQERRKKLDSIWSQLEGLAEQEQEAYDNLPEPIQTSSKGDKMQEDVDTLEEAKDLLRDVIDR